MNLSNLPEIVDLLNAYPVDRVKVYCEYIKNLWNETKSGGTFTCQWWMMKLQPEDFADKFIKVAVEGLFIDGDVVSLAFRGKLMPVMSYHAYRRKMLITYPETEIIANLVREGDELTFDEKDGVVNYTHKFATHFPNPPALQGVYCIIKNNTGAHLTRIGLAELQLMEDASLMKGIWKKWKGQMFLKSAIKRNCKTFYYDDIKGIDAIDNESYDLEALQTVSDEYKTEAKEQTAKEKERFEAIKKEVSKLSGGPLNIYFRNNREEFEASEQIIELFQNRKNETEKPEQNEK